MATSDKKDEILTYKPLAADSAVSANPHIPSVSASAVLGESESVSSSACNHYYFTKTYIMCIFVLYVVCMSQKTQLILVNA